MSTWPRPCALGGVDIDDAPTLSGVDLSPALADPSASPRDYVFFAQDAAQSDLIANTRYAVQGFFDGETKYARYYGIGGGVDQAGNVDERPKLFGEDAAEDHDHEWYEPANDPHELINLANDVGRKGELREHFNRLLEIELAELATKPAIRDRRDIWSGEAPVPSCSCTASPSTQMTWVEPGWFDLVKEGGRRPLGYDLLGHGDADTPDDIEAYKDLVTPLSSSCRSPDEGRQIDIVGYSLGRTALDLTLRHPQLGTGWCWAASVATSSPGRRWEPVRSCRRRLPLRGPVPHRRGRAGRDPQEGR